MMGIVRLCSVGKTNQIEVCLVDRICRATWESKHKIECRQLHVEFPSLKKKNEANYDNL